MVSASAGLARRLRILQIYAGVKTQEEMAGLLDIQKTRWNNMLNGRILTMQVALKIHEKFPQITLEWLWLGETDQLRLETLRQLTEIDRKLPSQLRDVRGRKARR